MTTNRIISILRPLRLSLGDEKRLQAEIADAFTGAGLSFEREVRLSPRDVIDFMVGGVGCEIKVRGSKMAIYGQLERYAEFDAVKEILLVSNVPMGLPPEIGGKPAYFHNLAMAWL